jgi:hypothetical protein
MARTVAEIKQEMGNAYMAQPEIRGMYALTDADIANGFDRTFSIVSVESMLFYGVAMAIYVMERTLDAFRTEIQQKIDGSYIASKEWWHAQTMAYQKGADLELDQNTFVWKYTSTNPTNQLIKRVAIREGIDPADNLHKVMIFVAGEGNDGIEPISASDLANFNIYCNRIKPAGVLLKNASLPGDVVDFGITVNYNPLLLSSNEGSQGQSIAGSNYPVTDAVNQFIDTLNDVDFGGKLNLTKLIDAIQQAEGVVDAQVTAFTQNGVVKPNWGTFKSLSGWFKIGTITVGYQPQNELEA